MLDAASLKGRFHYGERHRRWLIPDGHCAVERRHCSGRTDSARFFFTRQEANARRCGIYLPRDMRLMKNTDAADMPAY